MKQPFVAAFLLVAACTPLEPPRLEAVAQASGGRPAHVMPLLAEARRDFFGPGPGGGGGGGEAGGGFGLSEPVELGGGDRGLLGLGLRWTTGAAGGWHVSPGLALTRHHARAFLPRGLGVFTDPMRAEMLATTLSARLDLQRDMALGGDWTASYGPGLGVQATLAQGHLRSSLIDLRSELTRSDAFLALQAGLRPPQGPGLSAEVLYYGPEAAEYRLGLVQRF